MSSRSLFLYEDVTYRMKAAHTCLCNRFVNLLPLLNFVLYAKPQKHAVYNLDFVFTCGVFVKLFG